MNLSKTMSTGIHSVVSEGGQSRRSSRRSSILDLVASPTLQDYTSSWKRSQSFGHLDVSDLRETLSRKNSNRTELSIDEETSLISGRHPLNKYNYPESTIEEEDEDRLLSIGLSKSNNHQTILNAINVLIGVGLLSLPLGLYLSGWILGITFLSGAAFLTKYTAILLGRCTERDPSLRSYNDIGKKVLGRKVNYAILLVFLIDLLGGAASLAILFVDSLSSFFPEVPSKVFRLVFGGVVVVFNFLPLNGLSFLSFIGILSTSSVVVIVIISGLLKSEAPGSIFQPEVTNFWPTSFVNVLIAYGIFLCPFGGHPVLVELYRDMRHPEEYSSCMDKTFSFTLVVNLFIGIFGFLMFGMNADSEITRNIMLTENYPKWIPTVVCVFMTLLPLSKTPLVLRPVITAIDDLTFTETELLNSPQGILSPSTQVKRIFSRIAAVVIAITLSVTFNSFSQVLAILGSFICTTICIILPTTFYILLFKDELSYKQKVGFKLVIVVFIILAILGTIAAALYG
ncbi:BA75_00231T0 [Komagataella pastoris]|uniref:BA75_00231T0 n=1 Tax=Komagataella pastoris TaxID=4922 RepID=A0A1B2J8M9_PICPA|nr:BA75_00231T0 [Komagataella pastoris]